MQANWYDGYVRGDGLDSEDYKSNGYAASLEMGHAWLVNGEEDRSWKIEPQGQIIYSYLDQDDHTEVNGTRITQSDKDSILTRLGVRVSNLNQKAPGDWQPWTSVNWLNGDGATDLQFNGETLSNDVPEDRALVEVGITGKLNEAMTLSVRATGEWGENSYDAYGGHILWNYRW